jgi:hypothetical protein
MGVLENRLLRRVLECQGKEVLGGWENLHYNTLRSLQCSPDITRMV